MLLYLVCLTLLASFFLPSHLSFKNMYMHVHLILYFIVLLECLPYSLSPLSPLPLPLLPPLPLVESGPTAVPFPQVPGWRGGHYQTPLPHWIHYHSLTGIYTVPVHSLYMYMYMYPIVQFSPFCEITNTVSLLKLHCAWPT